MLLQLSHFFLPFIPLHPAPIPYQQYPPQFMSMGRTYKLFGFYISLIFFTSLCLFSTYNLCYLLPVPFPPFPSSPYPLITLHVICISVILFLFWWFAKFVFVFVFFQVQLLIVVNLLSFQFMFLISFFRISFFVISLDKSL